MFGLATSGADRTLSGGGTRIQACAVPADFQSAFELSSASACPASSHCRACGFRRRFASAENCCDTTCASVMKSAVVEYESAPFTAGVDTRSQERRNWQTPGTEHERLRAASTPRDAGKSLERAFQRLLHRCIKSERLPFRRKEEWTDEE